MALTRSRQVQILLGDSGTLGSSEVFERFLAACGEKLETEYGLAMENALVPEHRVLSDDQLIVTLNLNGKLNCRIGKLMGGREEKSLLAVLSDLLGCEVGLSKMNSKQDVTRDMIVTSKSKGLATAIAYCKLLCFLLVR